MVTDKVIETDGSLERSRTILAACVAGVGSSDIARMVSVNGYKCSPQYISNWKARHASQIQDVLDAMQVGTTKLVAYQRLYDRDQRINDLGALLDKVKDWITEHGIAEVTTEYDQHGNVKRETVRINDRAIAAYRGLYDDIAQELGQRSKVQVNVDARQIIVREVKGVDVDAL